MRPLIPSTCKREWSRTTKIFKKSGKSSFLYEKKTMESLVSRSETSPRLREHRRSVYGWHAHHNHRGIPVMLSRTPLPHGADSGFHFVSVCGAVFSYIGLKYGNKTVAAWRSWREERGKRLKYSYKDLEKGISKYSMGFVILKTLKYSQIVETYT